MPNDSRSQTLCHCGETVQLSHLRTGHCLVCDCDSHLLDHDSRPHDACTQCHAERYQEDGRTPVGRSRPRAKKKVGSLQ